METETTSVGAKERIEGESVVRVVHLSDLHMEAEEESGGLPRFPHRGGHYRFMPELIAATIASIDPHVVVVTGDLTRTGTLASVKSARAFLNRIAGGRHLVTVPGNHDCFDGGWRARKAPTNYYQEFPLVTRDPDPPVAVGGMRIVFHQFLSNHPKSLGLGVVDSDWLEGRDFSSDAVHVGVVHHNPLPHPRNRISRLARLVNAREVLMHFMSHPYSAVLYGHTHWGNFDVLAGKDVLRLLSRSPQRLRGLRRWRRDLVAKLLQRRCEDDPIKVPPCRSGEMLHYADRVDYLMAVHDKLDVSSPADFKCVDDFNKYLDGLMLSVGRVRRSRESVLADDRVAMSMAPSACQMEVSPRDCGFHVIELRPAGALGSAVSRDGLSVSALDYRYDPIKAEFVVRGRYKQRGLKGV